MMVIVVMVMMMIVLGCWATSDAVVVVVNLPLLSFSVTVILGEFKWVGGGEGVWVSLKNW